MTTGAAPDAPDELDELADLLAAPPTEHTTEDPARRRRVRRAWIIAAATVLVLVGAGGGYVAWALAAPPPAPVSSTRVPTVAPGPVAAPVLPAGRAAAVSVTGAADSLDGASRESVDADVTRLLESIRAGFHDVTVARAGTLVGSVETEWGASAQLVLAQDAALLTWSDTPITATLDPQPPASFRDGARAGTATWVAGSQSVSVPVEVRGDIAPPTNEWLLTHPPLLWR